MTRSIVMSKGFADETAKMDGTLKQKVLTFMGKFQCGVDGGLDLKMPKGARSKVVWTARVTDNFRAVPPTSGRAPGHSSVCGPTTRSMLSLTVFASRSIP